MAAHAKPGGDVAPRVVVIAAGPADSGRRQAELGPALGGQARVDELEALLARRARAWARGVAGDATLVAAPTELSAALTGRGVAGAGPDGAGPTIVVWPELPVWRPDAAAAALGDLAAGCAVSIGPLFDSSLYLLALAEPIPELPALAQRPMHGMEAIAHVFKVVEQRELEVGLLRAERGLRSPDDVGALRADPLTDGELRTVVGL